MNADPRAELVNLIIGRTATAAANAIIAAGWVKPNVGESKVVHVTFDDDEEPIVWRCACDCSCEDPADGEGELCSSCTGSSLA